MPRRTHDSLPSSPLRGSREEDGGAGGRRRRSGRDQVRIGQIAFPVPELEPEQVPDGFEIARVISAGSGYPLVGVHAALVITGAGERPVTIGEDSVGRGGKLTIRLSEAPEAREALCLLEHRPEAGMSLTLSDPATGEELATVSLQTRGPDTLPVLEVPVTLQEPDPILWRELASRLESSRIGRVHQTVQHLLLAAPGASVFADWSTASRLGAVLALEHAFLDPTGAIAGVTSLPSMYVLSKPGAWDAFVKQLGPETSGLDEELQWVYSKTFTFVSLLTVDYALDPGKLATGNAGDAISITGPDNFIVPDVWADPDFWSGPPDPKLVGYRDYLRTIFTGPPNAPTYQQRIERLSRRFGQDFESMSTLEWSANAIVAAILTTLLTRPTGEEYGFGLSPGQIEAQGERTRREYLDYLIGLTGLSAAELGRRYRLDFGRGDDAVSSFVAENIATLQGFFRDGFQGGPDPHPIFPALNQGRAPFFLYYEEWLRRTGPFYAENFWPLKESCALRYGGSLTSSQPAWFHLMEAALVELRAGNEDTRLGEYRMAREHYLEAWQLGVNALLLSTTSAEAKGHPGAAFTGEIQVGHNIVAERDTVHAITVDDEVSLQSLVERFTAQWATKPLWAWLEKELPKYQYHLVRLCIYIVPASLGDLAVATGDYARANDYFGLATQFFFAHAAPHGAAGWPTSETVIPDAAIHPPLVFKKGPLPYTAITAGAPPAPFAWGGDALVTVSSSSWGDTVARLSSEHATTLGHPLERRLLRLKHGEALLAWGDALYRSDVPEQIARARELYKAVLYLHGSKPQIDPTWVKSPFFLLFFGNPAHRSQIARAQRGIAQIDADLNYYGLDDRFVPVLRYSALKGVADRFAGSAKAAERDLIGYIERIEEGLEERIVQKHALAKAQLNAQVAQEQVGIATFELQLAEQQVKAIEKQIVETKKEIADHDGLFTQFREFVGGMKSAIDDLPKELKKTAGSGSAAAAGFGTYEGVGAFSSLSAGGAAMAGYGVFVYAGYTSMSAMGAAQNSRRARLKVLMEHVLPLAKAAVRARQRQVTIAHLQEQIADADAQLALDLLHFSEQRFLNLDLWAELAALSRRLLHRYLDLGGRAAWLAERALAYEQHRSLKLIRLDYIPVPLQGLGGADLLHADLAELEAARVDGTLGMVPITHTFSLAFDFPVEFVQLKKTGRCTIRTDADFFRHAHLGTYGHRVRAATVSARSFSGVLPYRGLLSNGGVSRISTAEGDPRVSLRTPDAQAISEFRLEERGRVFDLPGEALLTFEGSGIDTEWTVEFPHAANPHGLQGLVDVGITFDLVARFSPERYAADVAAGAGEVERSLLVSAAVHDPTALAQLQAGGGAVSIAFPFAKLLPPHESDRSITNVLLLVAGEGTGAGTVMVGAAGIQPIAVSLTDGMAVSNAPPFSAPGGPPSPAPLNALVGEDPGQTFTVSVDPAQVSGTVVDVVLGLMYTASV